MIVAERNRERRTEVKRVRKSIARLIAALEKELAEIDAEIDAGVRGSPAGAKRRTCSPPCQALARSRLARSLPRWRNSVRSTANKSPASRGLRPSFNSPAVGKAKP